MTRLVSRTATGPITMIINGETLWFCACGLSNNQPFCDGSHKATAGEPDGALCWYDDAGNRRQTDAEVAGIRSGKYVSGIKG
jgi:CDGSH-type Zn-finger protein